jgi:hypothetical protein
MDDDYVNLLISTLTPEQMKQIIGAYLVKRVLEMKVPGKKLGSMRNIRAIIRNKILNIMPEYTSDDFKSEFDDIAHSIKLLVSLIIDNGNISRDTIEMCAEKIGRAIGDMMMKPS